MATDTLERPDAAASNEDNRVLVTLTVGEQLCGVPVLAVRDILGEQVITRIPLAPPEIAGSLNLRGRIVTAIDLRRRLRLPPAPPGQARMAVVAEQGGELYALLVDQVSEVLSLDASMFERNPPTLQKMLGRVQHRHLPSRRTPAGRAGRGQAAGIVRSGVGDMTRTCLVVDDSRVVRKVARRILEAHGFAVTEAVDGQKALDACHEHLPDCVLLDWNMPIMDGLQFLRALRKEFGPNNPPVVFCTTENDIGHIEIAISNGAQEYIMKPFDEDILTGKLAQLGLL
jgi:CheY-like chemotaxis protein